MTEPVTTNPILLAFAESMRARLAAKAKTDLQRERADDQRSNLRIGERARKASLRHVGGVAGVQDLLLLSGSLRERHVEEIRTWLMSLSQRSGSSLLDGEETFTLTPSDLAAIIIAASSTKIRDMLAMTLAVGEPPSEGRLAILARAFASGREER